MLRHLSLRGFCALAVLLITVVAHGAQQTWTIAADGDFGDPANWTGGVPGAADEAIFNTAGTYTVTFDNDPNPLGNPVLNKNLHFSAGDVAFVSGSGGPYTYQITSGELGFEVDISGGNLTLGTTGNPLHMTAESLNIDGDSLLNISAGSQLNATSMRMAASSGDNAAAIVDSPGSSLNVPASIVNIGVNGGTDALTYRNSATGILGGLHLGFALVAGTDATLNVESNADVTIISSMVVAPNGSAATTATVNVNGTGSILTQGISASLQVGGSQSTGNVNVGTTVSGGTFSTGTGTTTINANGNVTIGSGTNTGIFNANGDVMINGGTLQRQNAGSEFNLAAGKTMTIQNGGTATFDGIYATASNAFYNVAGPSSSLNFGGLLEMYSGAQINVTDGGELHAVPVIGSGMVSVDGNGSALSFSGLGGTLWGIGDGMATLTFSNGASGDLNAVDIGFEGGLVRVESGASLTVANFSLVSFGVQETTATLDIRGVGSNFTQSGASNLTVGHSSVGTAIINVGTTNTEGTLNTGTGLFTINATGMVNVGSGANTGRLVANGDVTIDGGQLSVTQASEFSLDDGKTITIQNGGSASFEGTYATNANNTYNISGASSKLETDFLQLRLGSQMTVSAGGILSSASTMYVGSDGDGTLTVDGAGSTATSVIAGDAVFGFNGAAGTAVFRNNATGAFGTILLAHGATAGTGNFTIESGANVTADGLQMAVVGGAATAATLIVDGPGSSLTLSPSMQMQIGHASTGSAMVNVRNSGSLIVGNLGSTALRATSTINIDGGFVDLGILLDQGGAIYFNYGSLSYIGNLNVGTNGLLGSFLYLGSQQQLALSGTTTVDAFHTLLLASGSLSTGSLVVNGTFDFYAGTLSITGPSGLTIGAGGPLGANFTLGAGRTLNVTNTATINSGALLVLQSGGSFNAGTLANNGTVVLDGVAAVLGGAEIINSGLIRGEGTVTANVINDSSGEIRAQNGKTLTFSGAGNNNDGTINLQGGTAEFSQGLVNASSGRILGRGTLIAGGGGFANSGNVAFSSGITDVFGNVINNTGATSRGITISGNADVTFWNDVTNVAGSLLRVSSGSSATFFGTFSGAGITGAGDVYFESDINPGASPALVNFGGDVFLGSGSTLNIELGGTSLGSQFDHVEVAGAATLDGRLQISLLNSFVPGPGDTFEVLRAAGGIFGEFASSLLPALSGGKVWSIVYSNFAVLLQVTAPDLPGDFNFDGTVDAADYVVWRKGPGYTQDDYNTWRTNFGRSTQAGGGGLAGDSSSQSSVPEPAAVVLVALAAAFTTRFGRRVTARRHCSLGALTPRI